MAILVGVHVVAVSSLACRCMRSTPKVRRGGAPAWLTPPLFRRPVRNVQPAKRVGHGALGVLDVLREPAELRTVD